MFPILYFARKNNSLLHLTKSPFYGKILLHTCTNGSSELMSNISASVVTMLYNFQLMRIAGEDGIAAYGAIMYVSFIFSAIFIGYAVGSAPIIGYHFGAGNTGELKNLLRTSLKLIGVVGCLMTALSFVLSAPMSRLFVGYDQGLYELTVRGFQIYAFSFLLCGLNIFGSAFFTALNNGLLSAIISFLRTLVFQSISVLALPIFLDIDGIWLAIIAAELAALAVTSSLLIANRKKYQYG